MKYLLLIFSLFSFSALADCQIDNEKCAPINEWQFSLSMGIGVHTNPLNGGDNIPLFLVPSVSYYGGKLFFDNGMLGYSLIDHNQIVVSAVTEINLEKSYFERWHPQNIFFDRFSALSPPNESVNINQIDNKRWALDAGLQINWFINAATDVSAKLLHDVNGVYNSYTANISINHTFNIPYTKNTFVNLGLGAQINSAKLVDYYYGVNQTNSFHSQVEFQGKTSINPFIRVKLSKVLNRQWRLFFNWKRKIIDTNTADSPLIKTRQIDTVFLGMEYAF